LQELKPTTTSTLPTVPTCPSSCNDNDPCTIDYCGSLTGYQCGHETIPGCGVPVQNATVEETNISTPISKTPMTFNIPVLKIPATVGLTIDNSIATEDLMKVGLDINHAVIIANETVALDELNEVKITKSGDNVTYSVEATKKEKFLFFDFDVPRKVTIDASNGKVVSVEKKTAVDVVFNKIVKTIFFWMK